MYQHLEISVERLSAPVEILNIDRRVRRQLQRASMYTVAEVILAGKRKLTSARSIGDRTANRIIGAVAGYLGVPEEFFAGKEVISSQERAMFGALEAPISVLHLPSSTLYALRSVGLFRIKALVKSRPNGYANILGLSEKDKEDLDRELGCYLAKIAQAHLLPFIGIYATLGASSFQSSPKTDLGVLLQMLGISERDWSVLEHRAMHFLTLENLGAEFGGIGKEAVRRIIEQAHESFQHKLNLLSGFLDHFEEKSKALHRQSGNLELDRKALVLHLLPGADHPALRATEKDVDRMIVLIRTLSMRHRSSFIEEAARTWEAFVLLACFVHPLIENSHPVKQFLEEQERKKKKKTYKELAYMVLARAGTPMHWSEIARQAECLGGRDSFEAVEIHTALNCHKTCFVRVGRGTYALREWGTQPVEFYHVIVASVLKREKKPLPFEAIYEKVSAIRSITYSTLLMSLQMHPRFYRSVDKTYGLRGWLIAGEFRGALHPEWLVEDETSVRRVARAKAKGWNIDEIIAEDRLLEWN
jgi:DNA-directed RNA polymerase delta subunit